MDILQRALKILFHPEKHRLDHCSWSVQHIKYIIHKPVLKDSQGFHVDVGHHYDSSSSVEDDQKTWDNFGGYSIFLGLDRKNYLQVAEVDEKEKRIKEIQTVEFPFKSVLVISSNRVHQGCAYSGDSTIFQLKTCPATRFSLKGFLSINEYGDDPSNLQKWFIKGYKLS